MSSGQTMMLVGLFGIPTLLLWAGHHLRRKSVAVRGIFWGGLAGHTVAAVVAIWFSMVPPEAWSSVDTARGFAGFYGMLLGSVAGALIGLALSTRFPRTSARDR